MAPPLRRPRVAVLALTLLIALLSLVTLYAPRVTAETLSPDGLLSKLDKNERVMLTAADGSTREITAAEMDRLAKQQHAQQIQMQREKSDMVAANGNDAESENAPKRQTESLADIQKKNPQFATNIELSRRAFQEIQRHGYARGYAFMSFSEKEDARASKATKTQDAKNKKSKGKKSEKNDKREDYKVTLLLRAMRKANDRTAKTGTSAQKRESEPLAVSYEAQLLLDAQGTLSMRRLV